MADRQETDRDADVKEIARALNAQSTLLAAIVKAADHIVQTYVQLTTIKEPKDDKAKEVNMPGENIKRAIMKDTGELPGVSYEETFYEGYGPGGVAILLEVLTDNKNRTTPEIRHIMSKNGGNMGEAGCVSWMFEKKGYILVEKTKTDEYTLMSVALEFFFHAIGGREGLVDTAVRTSQSGYLQRRMINALQDLKVAYDGTVRSTGGRIIHFQYGEDSTAPTKSAFGDPVDVKGIVESIKEEV